MAHPLYGTVAVECSETAHIQGQPTGGDAHAAMLCLLNNLPEECRLLVAFGEHGRNGLSQIWRVRGCCHSAFKHDWISYIFFIT